MTGPERIVLAMLSRVGVEDLSRYTSSNLAELVNLVRERAELIAALKLAESVLDQNHLLGCLIAGNGPTIGEVIGRADWGPQEPWRPISPAG